MGGCRGFLDDEVLTVLLVIVVIILFLGFAGDEN